MELGKDAKRLAMMRKSGRTREKREGIVGRGEWGGKRKLLKAVHR